MCGVVSLQAAIVSGNALSRNWKTRLRNSHNLDPSGRARLPDKRTCGFGRISQISALYVQLDCFRVRRDQGDSSWPYTDRGLMITTELHGRGEDMLLPCLHRRAFIADNC